MLAFYFRGPRRGTVKILSCLLLLESVEIQLFGFCKSWFAFLFFWRFFIYLFIHLLLLYIIIIIIIIILDLTKAPFGAYVENPEDTFL